MDRKTPRLPAWAEAAGWAYQYVGGLSVAYRFKDGDLGPLLDVLSDLSSGHVPNVVWPAVVPSLDRPVVGPPVPA